MPCRDFEDDRNVLTNGERKELKMLEAAMCGILTVLENHAAVPPIDEVFAFVDWKEAGVSRAELERWWYVHKAADAVRRAREEAERVKAELKKSALDKLTDEEKQALGLK